MADTDNGEPGFALDFDADGLDLALQQLERRSHSFGSALTGALKKSVVQGHDLETVLRSLAQRVSELALDAGLKPLENLLSGAVSGLVGRVGAALPFEKGGVPGRVVPFAEGGVVRAPTYFPLGGETGLMGEAGAEAILPLQRGADGRLGVAAAGGSASGRPIVFNVTSPDAASFRKSETQISAMLARAVGRGSRGL